MFSVGQSRKRFSGDSGALDAWKGNRLHLGGSLYGNGVFSRLLTKVVNLRRKKMGG